MTDDWDGVQPVRVRVYPVNRGIPAGDVPCSNMELVAFAAQIEWVLRLVDAPRTFFAWRWRDALRASAGFGAAPPATQAELLAIARYTAEALDFDHQPPEHPEWRYVDGLRALAEMMA